MGRFSEGILDLVAVLGKRAAANQAGIIAGDNPTKYNASDPFRLWVIQVGIIICFTQLLSLLLSRLRQPRVIAEVIGGVLLGPSVMGHIPNFTSRIFPTQSIAILTLTADVGLVFFLFLVGLEIDTRIVKRNAKAAFAISAVGLVIPLGLGAALAVPLYHEFVNPDVKYGYFILFVAVAIGITAFPVLCRILTETRLLDTTVGVVTLSAGVGNDIVGWILLALAVALVNSGSGLTALWVLLAAVGYVLFLLFPVRWALKWLARKTGSLESGQPSTFMMSVTLLLVLVSAFFTDIIGIHPIFGAFVTGLIIPHEGGFAISLVQKLEDIITLLFVPVYFALSGLNTNLSTLNTGKTWGYIVLICTVAFFAKFLGCFATARISGFNFRESGAIGTLMSCKGLVELIVLNVGFNANILDTRTFSMFVLHAIVLTFMTTPLTLLWYPPKYRTYVKQAVISPPSSAGPSFDSSKKTNFAVILNRLDHVPAFMSLMQLLQRPLSTLESISTRQSLQKDSSQLDSAAGGHIASMSFEKSAIEAPLEFSALRLVELTERTSDVLKSQEVSALVHSDPLLSLVKACARPFRARVSSSLAVLPTNEFAERVISFSQEVSAHVVVIPWTISVNPEETSTSPPGSSAPSSSPLDVIFGGSSPGLLSPGVNSSAYSQFARKVFTESPSDVALFVDRFEASDNSGVHIFLPFFGGPDDRLALEFVVQLCSNPSLRATVVRIRKSEETGELDRLDSIDQAKAEALANFTLSGGNVDTVYGVQNTQTKLHSDTADNLLWTRYSTTASQVKLPHNVQDALSRIDFRDVGASTPLHTVLTYVTPDALTTTPGELLFVSGRSRRLAVDSHREELKSISIENGKNASVIAELSKVFGDVTTAVLAAGHQMSILVLQASIKDSTA